MKLSLLFRQLERHSKAGSGVSNIAILDTHVAAYLSKYSKPCVKRQISKRLKIYLNFQDQLSVIQVKSIADAPMGSFCNTFDLH